MPEWWFWYYYHRIDLSDSDLDSEGVTLLNDYTNGYDPNVIQFSAAITNDHVNTRFVPMQLTILAGVPAFVAVLVNNTNVSSATWQPYTNNIVGVLGTTDGVYNVSAGLRGWPATARESWSSILLYLDTTPPSLQVSNPVIVSTPFIQLQGMVNEELSSLTFDVSNALQVLTNQTGYTSEMFYDTNLLMFTTNSFQLYDVPLTNGDNAITIYATDLAGNETTTNFTVTLDYSSDTNPPELNLIWPQDGTLIAGSNFTVQAQIDDNTAAVRATIAGQTNQGSVYRNGKVLVENLSLAGGTNLLSIAATDAAGNSMTTNIAVIQSAITLTIDPLTDDQLNQTNVYVTGTVGDTNEDVYVNGVQATVYGDGTWDVYGVPVNATGLASLNAQMYPIGSDPDSTPPDGGQNAVQEQPDTVILASYSTVNKSAQPWGFPWNDNYSAHWTYEDGGGWLDWGFDTGNEPPFQEVFYSYSDDFSAHTPPLSGPPWENALMSFFNFSISTKYSSEATMRIVPGDKALGEASAVLYLIWIKAFEYSDPYNFDSSNVADLPLAPEQLRINGKPVINSGITNDDGSVLGYALITAPASAPADLKITKPQLGVQRYDFDVLQPQRMSLRIIDANTGADLTGQTNTVIVGQQMNLRCELSQTNAQLQNSMLQNIQWSVPGFAISNYVVAADASSAFVATNFPLNNSNVVFYWVDGANKRTVQVSAIVNGVKVEGQAAFNILRPTHDFIGSIDAPIAYDTNYFASRDGLKWLHFGGSVSNGVTIYGINCLATNVSMQGVDEITSYGFFAVQTIFYITNTLTRSDNSVIVTVTNGLDNYYPTTLLGDGNGLFSDLPAVAYHTDYLTNLVNFSVIDSFRTVTMFQPFNGIPIPIKEVDWKWFGTVSLTGSEWMLTSSNATISVNNQSITNFPVWTNIVKSAQLK